MGKLKLGFQKWTDNKREDFYFYNSNYFITSDGVEGLNLADFNLYTEELALTDGAVVTGRSLPARAIKINWACKNTNPDERDRISRYFSDDLKNRKFMLVANYQDNKWYWLDVYLSKFEITTEAPWHLIKGTLTVTAPNPWFKSNTETCVDFSSVVGCWGYPFCNTADHSQPFSYFKYGDYIWCTNNGDVDTYGRFIATFSGDVSNLTIYQGYKSQNKYFKINYNFKDKDNLYINFETGQIIINGANAWKYINLNSQKLFIPKGGGYILIEFTGDKIAVDAHYKWEELYASI